MRRLRVRWQRSFLRRIWGRQIEIHSSPRGRSASETVSVTDQLPLPFHPACRGGLASGGAARWPSRCGVDNEIETHHAEAHAPAAAIQRLAGALPASASSPQCSASSEPWARSTSRRQILGAMIGSALVGTSSASCFAYGIVEPLGRTESGGKWSTKHRINYTVKQVIAARLACNDMRRSRWPSSAGARCLYPDHRPRLVRARDRRSRSR